MIPEGLATLYAFLGLVAPGLFFQMLREKRRPALSESAFREASHVALTSLVFTTVSVLALATVSRLRPGILPDLAQWVSSGDKYAAPHLWLIVWGLTVEVTFACFLAFCTHKYLERSDTAVHGIVHGDIWNPLFASDLPADSVAWLKVELTSGQSYWGYVDYFTVGQDPAEREIVLKGPKMQFRQSADGDPANEDYWTLVVLKYSEIRVIKVRYEPRAQPERVEARRSLPRALRRQQPS